MENNLFAQNKIIKLNETNSTNDFATSIIKEKDVNEGTIVWALSQSNGKGQHGNKWESKMGENLTFSIILKPFSVEPSNQFMLNKAISLSLLDFLNQLIPDFNFSIKWPNDIYYNKKKIVGILIENQIMGSLINYSIVGIGLNVNQVEFSKEIPNPVSLKLIAKKSYSLESLLLEFLPFLESRLNKLYSFDYEKLNSDYLNNLLNYNIVEKYQYKNQIITAKITGISKFGKLELEYNQKKIDCDLKEIQFIHI